MASKLPLLLLLTLLSSLHTHARDSEFFNKIPTKTTNNVVPDNKEVPINQQQQQEPNFLPENENSYGLYGHESGQNPPSTVATPGNAEFKQPDRKYLPKNYNPVAYVTQPEDFNENVSFNEETSFTTNPDNNNYYNGAQNFNNNNKQQQEGEAEEEADFRSYPTTTNNRENNYYYNGGSSFNSQPQGRSSRDNYGGANGFQPQGMSDTRVVANGKYFYDLGSEKFSSNHPYEALKAQNEFNSRNFYQNNADEFNNRNFYQNNADEFSSRNFYQNNANEFSNRNFYENNADEFNNRNLYGNNGEEFQNEENMP